MSNVQIHDSSARQRTLAEAVDGLYSTFSRCKLHGPVVGCAHCTSGEDNRLLCSKPLNQLDAADLQRFARKAISTLGTADDVKHFLPRILELAALQGSVGDTCLEIVLDKLPYAGWMGWRQDEQEAVRRFLMAFWQFALETYPAAADIDSVLCGIGAAEDDLRPYLAWWQTDPSFAAMRHLANFIDWNNRALFKGGGKLMNAFWKRDAQQEHVIAWLLEPQTSPPLERAFFECSDPAIAEELSLAVERLVWLRRRKESISV